MIEFPLFRASSVATASSSSRSLRKYNKVYLAPVLHTFAQIQPNGWTSDTLGTLSCNNKDLTLLRSHSIIRIMSQSSLPNFNNRWNTLMNANSSINMKGGHNGFKSFNSTLREVLRNS